MDSHDFCPEDLHLDLGRKKSKKKKKFRNLYATSGVRKLYSPQSGSSQRIRIHFFTWNTNARPPPHDLDSAFPAGVDIYVISLQEVGSQDWLAVFDPMFKTLNVVRVKVRRMQGIMSIVYVRRDMLTHLCHIESEITRTGLGGMWGNKGGVSIRFEIFGVSFIAINCHLAAHMEKVIERLQDINSILEGQKFKDPEADSILDHDYVFWMGDMNFRVEKVTHEEAIQKVEEKAYDKLLETDQLRSIMSEGSAFLNFTESPITFAPTYKFDVGTNIYDTSGKKRVPAYCDRILHHHHDVHYSKHDDLMITPFNYVSCVQFTSSDHKPVMLTADINGLISPPANPVTFKKAKTHSAKLPFVVKYQHKPNFLPSPGDWIGLYKSEFMHFDEYVTYAWVRPSSQGAGHVPSVIFSTPSLKKLGSHHHFMCCYISKQFHFCGISPVYEINHYFP